MLNLARKFIAGLNPLPSHLDMDQTSKPQYLYIFSTSLSILYLLNLLVMYKGAVMIIKPYRYRILSHILTPFG